MISAFHVLRDTIPSILKIRDAHHASRMQNVSAEILFQLIKGIGEKIIRAIKFFFALKNKPACKNLALINLLGEGSTHSAGLGTQDSCATLALEIILKD
jgi:hypothetical protein